MFVRINFKESTSIQIKAKLEFIELENFSKFVVYSFNKVQKNMDLYNNQ